MHPEFFATERLKNESKKCVKCEKGRFRGVTCPYFGMTVESLTLDKGE